MHINDELDVLEAKLNKAASIQAEINDLALTKTLHVDELTQLDDIATDMVGISNQVGMTILEVDGGTESPRLPLTHHLLGGNRGSYWGLGWKDRGL